MATSTEQLRREWAWEKVGKYLPLIYVLVSLGFSYLVAAVVVWSLGLSPRSFFAEMFTFPLTTESGLSTTVRRMSPVLLSSLTLALSFKIGFWNVNSPGQLMLGAIAGAWLGINVDGLSPVVHVPLTLLGGFAAGAALGFILAFAKFQFNINEVLLSLLLNFVSFYAVIALIYGPMQGRPLLPYTAFILPSAELPRFFGRVHVGIVLAVVSVIAMALVVRYTVFGYRMTVIGKNLKAARAAGINVTRVGIATVCLSSGFSGLAGAMEVTGVYGYGFDTIVQGIGFYGMISAFIAFGELKYLIPATCLTSFVLGTGDLVKAYSAVLPPQTPQMLLGLIAFSLVITTAIGGLLMPGKRPK